jgi:hypothetical protein
MTNTSTEIAWYHDEEVLSQAILSEYKDNDFSIQLIYWTS